MRRGRAVRDPDLVKTGDLSVTALYTSAVWSWGGLADADLFETKEANRVFGAVNAALGLQRLFRPSMERLAHGLVQRHLMIDRLIAQSGCGQVLELACGLSRRGAALSKDPDMRVVEVDLPHVIDRKRALLESTERGRAVLARSNYALVAADVQNTDLAALADADGRPGLDPDRPVFVATEGLLQYLDVEASWALWRQVAALLSRSAGGAYAFDLVPWPEQPRAGVWGRLLGTIMKLFTGGRTFERDERSRADLLAQLSQAGLSDPHAYDAKQVAAEWDLPHADMNTNQVVFHCVGQVNR